jgi:hypothetical protein
MQQIQPDDLVVTADIPLAAAVIGCGAHALDPRGALYASPTTSIDRFLTRSIPRRHCEKPMRPFTSRGVIVFVALALGFGAAGPAAAAPEGTMTWVVHITLASRSLDPGEGA